MKILIVYFSFTSNTATVAEAIRAQLETKGEVTMATIEPRKQRGYWRWLARSFLPGWRVPIEETVTDLAPYDLIFLGFPKWTVSCPPINQYLKVVKGSRGKKFALFMSYGGFDEERYMQAMIRKVAGKGIDVVAAQSIRRRFIRQGTHPEAVRSLCRQALLSLASTSDPSG